MTKFGNIGNRLVPLEKPIRLKKSVQKKTNKEFKVYVRDNKGEIRKVLFGDPDRRLNWQFSKRRKSYCARSKPLSKGGDKLSPNFWSRKRWRCKND